MFNSVLYSFLPIVAIGVGKFRKDSARASIRMEKTSDMLMSTIFSSGVGIILRIHTYRGARVMEQIRNSKQPAEYTHVPCYSIQS